ncbi:MAG: siroheme synthase [Alphaproteobacteria bacterium]|nr:MAG: siroheme synthase [Alphaproteobacteria bacterium]
MIPVDLNVEELRLAVVAREKALTRRLRYLRRGGAKRIKVFSDRPEPAIAKRLGDRIIGRIPDGDDLKGVQVLFVAGLDPDETLKLVQMARRRRILVNCDGPTDKSDIHMPSVVRRGDLTVSISTSGVSPILANRLRKKLTKEYGKEWEQHVKDLAKARDVWLASGASPKELTKMINAMIDERDWLP